MASGGVELDFGLELISGWRGWAVFPRGGYHTAARVLEGDAGGGEDV